MKGDDGIISRQIDSRLRTDELSSFKEVYLRECSRQCRDRAREGDL